MNLPKFFKSKTSEPEHFFALLVESRKVSCAVWSTNSGRPQVLSTSAPVIWDGVSVDKFTHATDQAVTAVMQKIPEGVEISKVIFGVPSHWIHDEKITPQYSSFIKDCIKNLSLEAMGYVVTPEAILKLIQSSEGVPPTAIIVGTEPDYISFTNIRLGNIGGIANVVRHGDFLDSITEGFKKINTSDTLPSRIILFGDSSLIEASGQQLISHPWDSHAEHFKFLHIPRVETLTNDFSLTAIAVASGLEMVGRVSDEVIENSRDIEQPTEVNPESILGFTQIPSSASQSIIPIITQEAEIIEDDIVPPKPKISLPPLKLPKISIGKPLILALSLLLLFSIAGFVGLRYLSSAQIVLVLDSKDLSQDLDISSKSDITKVDIENLSIPATKVEVTVSDEATGNATGSKLVGDKAIGKVIIISGLSQSKLLPAGTTITSGTLQFTLDSNVTVASASGSADPNAYQPGKITANVTSSQIGTDSNLTAGTQFKISGFSALDLVAKNETAFSGGTSRQAKVVTKDDIAKLKSQLSTSLKESAKSKLTTNIEGTSTLISDSLEAKITSEEVNRKIDEAAESVIVKTTVRAQALTYNKSDIDSLVTSKIEKSIPEKYISKIDSSPLISLKSSSKTGSVLGVQIKAFAEPDIDIISLKKQLAGLNISEASMILSSLPGLIKSDIKISPPLPEFLKRLPIRESAITIKQTSN